jgi:multicomponent Na+:H+ antiporter subunit D
MVAAAGIGSELAVNGAAAHAVNNLLYKGLLFMCAGAVLVTTGRGNLADLGGLWRRQPLLLGLYLVGAASICGFPLWNGFLSKGMILSASGDEHRDWTFLLLGLASVGTFVSVGLKLPYFAWFGADRAIEPRPVPPGMLAAMTAAATLCTLIGFVPDTLYRFLPYATDYDAYTATHLIEVIQLLLFAGFAFFLLLPNLSVARKTLLDVDVFYRKAAPAVRALVVGRIDALFGVVQAVADRLVRGLTQALRDPTAWFADQRNGPRDFDADRSRPPLLSPLLLTIATFVLIAVVLVSWPRPAAVTAAPAVGASQPGTAGRAR